MSTFVRCRFVSLLVLAGAAHADTRSVPQQHATIQEAVDAAQAGDTVVVSAGVYDENVLVPPTKAGLTVRGKGKVFLDGHLQVDEVPHGMFVQAEDVTVAGIVFRHAAGDAIHVGPASEGVGPPGLRVEDCTFVNNGGGMVGGDGAAVVVRNCRGRGNGGGIQLDGAAGARIERVTIQSNGGGIVLTGADGAVVTRCVVENVAVSGISLTGADAEVSRNVVARISSLGEVAATGIDVFGAGSLLVTRNRVEGTEGVGIDVGGDDATVSSNQVAFARGLGFHLNLSGTILKNTASRIAGFGFHIGFVAADVRQNKAFDTALDGFVVVAADVVLTDNVAQRCGQGGGAGFFLSFASGSQLSSNTARDGGGSGFVLEHADGVTLVENRAQANASDGFAIDDSATETVLERNSALGNHAEGLQNEGSDTTITGNRFTNNKQDLANVVGNLIDGGGNVFETGGLDEPPQID